MVVDRPLRDIVLTKYGYFINKLFLTDSLLFLNLEVNHVGLRSLFKQERDIMHSSLQFAFGFQCATFVWRFKS